MEKPRKRKLIMKKIIKRGWDKTRMRMARIRMGIKHGWGDKTRMRRELCAHSISTKSLSACSTEEDKARIQFIYLLLLRIQHLLRKLEEQDTHSTHISCLW